MIPALIRWRQNAARRFFFVAGRFYGGAVEVRNKQPRTTARPLGSIIFDIFHQGPLFSNTRRGLPRLACRSRAPFSAPTFPRNDREPHEKRAPSKPEERRDHADRNGLPDDNESVCRWIDVDRGSSPSKMPDHVARHFCVPVKYPSYMEFQLFESISSSSSSFFLFVSFFFERNFESMYVSCM